ncbi:ATP-binding protein [Gracilibacillus sp. YIM 98692]|uniref:ATP-binding protein n=1 Tax=Gracilibacillus sp. YIM 98692 TaxID=2663532 RepID=UPI0013D025B1|nr:ATP-binding protein [Gracilibacillus sp. YIM 98692]
MKLRTKVQMFLSALILLFMLLMHTIVYLLYQNQVSEKEINRVRDDTLNVMEAIVQNNGGEIENQQLLQAFLPNNGLIRIIDADEQVIHDVSKQSSYYDWPFHYTQSEEIRLNKTEDGIPYVQVAMPIIWEDGSIVTLQVNEALYAMEDTLSTLQIVLMATAALMVIPAIIAGTLLAGYVTKPIQRLTKEMKSNPKDGTWDKLDIPSKSHDEINQMQHAYNEMIERIEENIRKQEQFVSDASHELKTPLSVISGYANLLKRRGKEKPGLLEEATQSILSETNRMQQLTEQMLMLARNEDKENLTYERFELRALIKEVIRSLSIAYDRNISFYDETDHHEIISADRAKLQQAIYILIDNACKYSDDRVIVSLIENNYSYDIQVQDFGEGLSESDQKQIFQRFYRVDKSRSRKAGGTGLGLAICTSIVRAHNGKLSVDSRIEEGSTFTISLPK